MTAPPARPLAVIALGGNALSPPAGDMSVAAERGAIERAVEDLLPLIDGGARLLVVHGNGPQVGRLLAGGMTADDLDVTVAQTQGELGYLLAAAIEARRPDEACAALITRARVDPRDVAFRRPTKPIGAVLPAKPAGLSAARTPDGKGWRRVVASPRPSAVVEQDAIGLLLASHHVIAGGGGGVPVGPEGPAAAVIDKDWTAALLAAALGAARLIYVTDVAAAYDSFAATGQKPITAMTMAEAEKRLAQGVFAEGSMRPKVESAVSFVAASGRPALITTIGRVRSALAGEDGTVIRP